MEEKEEMKKNRIVYGMGMGMVIAALTMLMVSVPMATASEVNFVPDSSSALAGETTNVSIWLDSTEGVFSFDAEIHFNSTVVNITDASVGDFPTGFGMGHYGDYVILGGVTSNFNDKTAGHWLLANLTLEAENAGTSPLDFNPSKTYLGNETGKRVPAAWNNGTFTCTEEAPINVSIRADSITGTIFDVSSYTVNPGTVTEDTVTINNQTAMGAVVAYCQDNGINVDITMGSYGEWLIQIGNNASDENNWMYAVNETVPGIGGAAYDLSGGERVHWYNYMLNYYTVLTTLNRTTINAGENITATVTWKNTTGTYPLSGASVNVSDTAYAAGPSVGTTDPDGNVTFEWSTPGTWYVYAEHPTYGSGIHNYPPGSFTCTGVVNVTVDAPDTCIPRQSQFNVDINVNPNNNEAYSAQYVLSFDPNVLRAETQVKEPFLTSDGNDSMVVINTVDNTAGETEYSETREDTTVGVTTPGTLATITFTAIGDTGTSSYLNLSEVIISDPTPEAMPDAWTVITNDSINICQNQPPVANATVYDDYNNVGSKYLCKVYFNASDSTDDSGISSYRWGFGDGNYGTGMVKEHVYTSWNWNGTGYEPFHASLTVTDNTPEPETGTNTTYFDVTVYIAGDANGDGTVNILDASMIGLEWMHTCNPPATCWRDTAYDGRADRADLNNDHKVNILDAVIVGTCWKHTAW